MSEIRPIKRKYACRPNRQVAKTLPKISEFAPTLINFLEFIHRYLPYTFTYFVFISLTSVYDVYRAAFLNIASSLSLTCRQLCVLNVPDRGRLKKINREFGMAFRYVFIDCDANLEACRCLVV